MNEDVLYIGTDVGVFVTLDRGRSWEVLQNGIPISPVHDLVVHPRDHDIVVGTHGRSIYVMNVESIEKLTSEVRDKAIHLFDLADVREHKTWDRDPSAVIRETKIEPLSIRYWMSGKGNVEVTVKDSNDLVVRRLKDKGHRGVNVLEWDLEVDRDIELGRQLKKAKKEIEKIKKDLAKLDKPADKDGEKEQPSEEADESDDEKEKAAKDKKKREKRSRLNLDLRNAKLQVEKIKEVMDEPKTYADLPEDTRENMIRKIYVSGGKYTVEIKAGKKSHSVTLQAR